MQTIRVQDLLPDKILVSRESARLLEARLRTQLASQSVMSNDGGFATLTVDFEGVEGVAPSFIDELVLVFRDIFSNGKESRARRLVLAHPPTRLSSKFEAIARGHHMSIQLLSDGSWMMVDAPPKST